MPTTGQEWKEKGNTFFKNGHYLKAIEAYDKGITIAPDMPELWSNKGKALYQLDRNEEAIVCLEKAIALKPDYATAIESLAKAKERTLAEPMAGAGSATPFASLAIDPLVKVLSFPKPKTVVYEGKEVSLTEAETMLGKPFTSELTIRESRFKDYIDYSHNELICNFLKASIDLPAPIDPTYLNIINQGSFGHSVMAHKPIPRGAVLGYYFGEILPGNTKVSHSAYDLNLCNDVSSPEAHLRFNIIINDEWSFMSLLMHLPKENKLLHEYAGITEAKDVATANVQWDTVNLFTKDKTRGAAIVVMFAQRDIAAGELIGFDYRPGYWLIRGMEPTLFNKTTLCPIAGTKLKPTSFSSLTDSSHDSPIIQTLGKTAKEAGQPAYNKKLGMSPAEIAFSMIESRKRQAAKASKSVRPGY